MCEAKRVFLSAQKMVIAAIATVGLITAQHGVADTGGVTSKSGAKYQYRTGVIQGFSPTHRFIHHENEPGFQELQTLYLGALSASESIAKYGARPKRSRHIQIVLREPYYVVLGETPLLITDVDLVFPNGIWGKPFLLLNGEFKLAPGAANESFGLLLRWAEGRGFN